MLIPLRSRSRFWRVCFPFAAQRRQCLASQCSPAQMITCFDGIRFFAQVQMAIPSNLVEASPRRDSSSATPPGIRDESQLRLGNVRDGNRLLLNACHQDRQSVASATSMASQAAGSKQARASPDRIVKIRAFHRSMDRPSRHDNAARLLRSQIVQPAISHSIRQTLGIASIRR